MASRSKNYIKVGKTSYKLQRIISNEKKLSLEKHNQISYFYFKKTNSNNCWYFYISTDTHGCKKPVDKSPGNKQL